MVAELVAVHGYAKKKRGIISKRVVMQTRVHDERNCEENDLRSKERENNELSSKSQMNIRTVKRSSEKLITRTSRLGKMADTSDLERMMFLVSLKTSFWMKRKHHRQCKHFALGNLPPTQSTNAFQNNETEHSTTESQRLQLVSMN